MVSGDYFRAMGIPLLDGQLFDGAVSPQSPRVVVVDQFLAQRQFPNASAVGQQLNFGDARNYTIIGVVGTINDSDLAKPVPEERIYYSAEQEPLSRMGLVVKTAMEPASIVGQVRGAMQAIDPEQAISEIRTMNQWIALTLSDRRTPMTLLTLFGAVALILAAIGIYGVLSFGVAQRVRELAIRQALGADRGTILSLVLGQGLWTAATGIVVGLLVAGIATQYMKSLLFAVQPFDAGVFAAVSLLLLSVAAAACYVPARRATRVDPVVALREI
jgi:putative ABC transport system permease protein